MRTATAPVPTALPPAAPGRRTLTARQAQILAALRREPGLGKSDLTDRLGLGWGTVCHHLRALARRGLLKEVVDGRRTRLYLPEHDERADLRLRVLEDPAAMRIAVFAAGRRQTTLLEMVTELGLTRKVVRTRVAKLLEANLLEDIGHGWPRFRTPPRVTSTPWPAPMPAPMPAPALLLPG